jgi:hypothetical protein
MAEAGYERVRERYPALTHMDFDVKGKTDAVGGRVLAVEKAIALVPRLRCQWLTPTSASAATMTASFIESQRPPREINLAPSDRTKRRAGRSQ